MRYKFHLFLVILLKIQFSLADSNSYDYALLAQRRLQCDINISEVQVAFVTDRYNDMISVVLERQQRVLDEIDQTNERLTLMQAVNSTYRYCIQQYKPELYTKAQAEEKFNACLSAAKAKSDQMMMDVETPLNLAKNTANVQLPTAIQNCGEFSSNNTQQEECVVAKVEIHSQTFDDELNSVQDKLEINLSISTVITRYVVECSFKTENKILVKIGKSLQLIDICLESKQISSFIAMT